MRPVTKRALVTSVVTALLATASILPGNAAMASDAMPDLDAAETVATQPGQPAEDTSESAPHSAPDTDSETAAAPEDEDASGSAPRSEAADVEETPAHNAQADGSQPEGAPAPAAQGESAPAETAPTTEQNTATAIRSGYANWDFMRSFREYVGVENETRTNVDLLKEGGSLLWKPAPGQSIDVNNLSTLRLQGEVNWLKYEGILNVSLSNPTIDFAKKQLLLSGSTAGTLSGKKASTFDQMPLLQMDDLTVVQKDGYILIHSLKPRVLDMSDDLVGFYRGAIGSPFVMTLELAGVDTEAPQPVLWNLFPEVYKNPGNKPILDPNEPIVNVDVDPYLAKCIREELELKEQAPITNKFIQSVQSLQCIGSNDDNDKMKSLRGLEGAKNLTMVRFGYNKISDLTPLAGLTNLHTVEVPGNNITDVSALTGLTKLGSLNISDNKISTLPDMKQMTELAIIKADNNRIKDLSPLPSGSEELRKLYFNNNRIESLEPLRTHVYLRELRVADNRISNVDALKDLRGLERVDLKNNFIADASAIAQWESLKENWDGNIPLSSLELRGNRFTNWNVLDSFGRRIKAKPEAGQESQVMNSRTLEEALAADRQADEAEAATQQDEKAEEPKTETPQRGEQLTPAGKTANITWGVRSQFRSYLKGLAKGEWTLSEGATGEFTFPGNATTGVDLATYAGSRSGGKVHFVGHEGLLDITIANPEVRFENGAWTFVADVASRPFNSKDLALLGNPEAMKKALAGRPAPEMRRFTLANLGAPVIAGTGDNMTATFNSFTLTSDGSEAFGRFYDPGRTDFDPIVVSVGAPVPGAEQPNDNAAGNDTPGGNSPNTDLPGNTQNPGNNPGAGTPQGPGAAPRAMVADLHWGVRKSFRDYVTGPIAHGSIEKSEGVTGQFVFPMADGKTISHRDFSGAEFKGKVRFTGHAGLLDLTIANPAIVREASAWKLMADVASRPFSFPGARPGSSFFAAASSGAPALKRVHLADLGGMDVKHGGGGATVSFSSAVLTEEGAAAFGGFYKVGNRNLDPITMVVRSADAPNTPPSENPKGNDPQNNTPGTEEPKNEDPKNEGPKTDDTQSQITAPNLTWGVRSQFRSYLKGLAQGSWTLSEGATGEFTFPSAKGVAVDLAKYNGSRFAGKVHFTGHHGLLDITIANPEIVRNGNTWALVADIASVPYNEKDMALLGNPEALKKAAEGRAKPALRRVTLATLSNPVVKGTGKDMNITFAKLTLTKEGSVAFGGFYAEGASDFDPIIISVGAPVAPKGSGDDPAEEKQPKDPKKNPGTTRVPDTIEKQQKKECAVDPHRKRITSGSLSWGVRSSFTTYVRGSIAKGGWNLNGVTWDGSTFNFPVSGGLYNTNTGSGTIYYSGTVQFYGHNGILDLTMSNPAVEISGNSGTLYMTVAGSDTSGNKFNLGRVAFASLGFNGVSVSDNALSFDGASVTLTDTGAKAFAGFYQAGTSLDAMSSSVSLTPATACDPETGELIEYDAFGGVAGSGGLASTGTEAQVLLWMSLMALALGAAALGARARQRI